ncbi:MAG: hypothetical protein Q9164_002739 [Protoblastenia rupestris]
MPVKDDLSDDFVAQLLAKDAKATTSRFSAYGSQGFLPRRAINNAPKPNTRFLKNIIKETDNHNTALRVKEAQELRERQRRLKLDRTKPSRSREDHGRLEDGHKQRLIKRRRTGSNEDDVYDRRRIHDQSCMEGNHSRHLRRDRSRQRYGEKSYDENDFDDDEGQDEERSRRHRNHHRHRRRRSPSRTAAEQDGRLSRSRSRSLNSDRKHRSRHRHRSRRRREKDSDVENVNGKIHTKKKHEMDRRDARTPIGHTDGEREISFEQRQPSPSMEDSDPLESIIGPPPPPPQSKIKSRGRGALTATSASAMDAHFSSNYDPSQDAHPDPDIESDDWDQALEALRDRQRWQQQGAERLRAAGFSEEEVAKWANGKKGGVVTEKGEEDVRWKGRGEGREWDRGKVVTGDGVETEVEWGRLKGN